MFWCVSLWWPFATSQPPFILNLHSRRQSSRVWRKHFHLCRLWMATSDWPQTPPTTSVRTSLHRVCLRASEIAAMAQSRKSLPWKQSFNNTPHMAVWNDLPSLIRSELAVNKLKKSRVKCDTFLLRQSPKTYDIFFLTVCVQVHTPPPTHLL